MAAGGMALQGAGGLLGAYGQMQAGEAEAQAAEMNAQIAEQNSLLAVEQAKENERRLRVQGRKVLGDISSGYGASGVTAEGSALEVLKSSAANIELDALNVRHEGAVKASMFRNEAKLSRYSGQAARTTGQTMAAATLLQAGGNMAKK